MNTRRFRWVIIEILALCLIVVFGTFFYLHDLARVPPGVYVDETVTGYNAYSLNLTRKDEYGKSFPVALRFFGSYSPPVYTYITIPLVRVFGLNAMAVRLASSVCGIFGIIVFFLLLKSLRITRSRITLLTTTFLFAITPWNVFFARTGYEIYLGFFLFFVGVLFCWLSLSRKTYLLLGFIFLSLSTYGAHLERYLSVFFAFSFLFLFRKNLFDRSNKIVLFASAVAFGIIQIPNFTLLDTTVFFSKSALFYSQQVISQAEKIRFLPEIIAIPLSFLREFFSQYVAYFSPRSLFFLPDPDPQRSIPDLATFYPWMVGPWFLGLLKLWTLRKTNAGRFIFLLLFLIPFPVALTKDPFSTQRALPLLLPISLVTTLGLDMVLQKIRLRFAFPLVVFLLVYSIVLLWRGYFVLLPHERARVWGYGFQQLAEVIKENPDKKFLIDQSRTKPVYIELAFFLAYPPAEFQQEVDQTIKEDYYNKPSFSSYYKFGNIETRNIRWDEDIYKRQILVGDEFAISEQQAKEHFLTKVLEVNDLNGNPIFRGYETNPEMKCKISPNSLCTL